MMDIDLELVIGVNLDHKVAIVLSTPKDEIQRMELVHLSEQDWNDLISNWNLLNE